MYSKPLKPGQIPSSTGVCPLAKHWFMALLLWLQCVLSIQCFLHRSSCCRRLFQTTSSTATRKWSNSTLAPSASLHQHHTANQVRELFQIRNFEPACSQSDPFRNAKCCWEERGTATPHPRCLHPAWLHTGAAGPAASYRCCQRYQHRAAQHGHCIQIPDLYLWSTIQNCSADKMIQRCPCNNVQAVYKTLWRHSIFRWDINKLFPLYFKSLP